MPLIDGDGRVQDEGLLGGLHDRQGILGPVRDTNWLGQPNVKRNLLGEPVQARTFWGNPVANDAGKPVYESGGGGGGGGGEAALVMGVLFLAFGLIIGAVWVLVQLVRGVALLIGALYTAWRGLIRQHPTAMLIVHLLVGMGAAYAALTLAGFGVAARVGGVAMVPAVWGWLRLTRRLPLIFMPINAALAGAALWWAASLTRADWEPVWAPLTAGLPLVGNLPVALAGLPLAIWFWTRGARRWPRVFHPLNLLLSGIALWFLLTRVWVAWQPPWSAFVAPVPLLPPVGVALLLGPLVVWLWYRGQERWPEPFIAANLLLFGGLLALTAHHTHDHWDGVWRHWAGGLPVASAPILAIAVAPVGAWGWLRGSRWKPSWFVVPNYLLTGAILWLALDRTRALWEPGWRQAWGDVPLRPDPALLAFVLPIGVWGWGHGARRWPQIFAAVRLGLLGLLLALLSARTRAQWEPGWRRFSGGNTPSPTVILLVLPLAIWGWALARGRWVRATRIATWVCGTLLLGWLVGRLLPRAAPLLCIAVALIPAAVLGWSVAVRRWRVAGIALTVLPWLVVGAIAVLAPDHGRATLDALIRWLAAQGIPTYN